MNRRKISIFIDAVITEDGTLTTKQIMEKLPRTELEPKLASLLGLYDDGITIESITHVNTLLTNNEIINDDLNVHIVGDLVHIVDFSYINVLSTGQKLSKDSKPYNYSGDKVYNDNYNDSRYGKLKIISVDANFTTMSMHKNEIRQNIIMENKSGLRFICADNSVRRTISGFSFKFFVNTGIKEYKVCSANYFIDELQTKLEKVLRARISSLDGIPVAKLKMIIVNALDVLKDDTQDITKSIKDQKGIWDYDHLIVEMEKLNAICDEHPLCIARLLDEIE